MQGVGKSLTNDKLYDYEKGLTKQPSQYMTCGMRLVRFCARYLYLVKDFS